MKKVLVLLLLPYLTMVGVNEYIGSKNGIKPYSLYGITAINSAEVSPSRCSWNCHNRTDYCLTHHVEVFKPYVSYINPIYTGIIGLLSATGSYALANIVFLVVLWPMLMALLIVRLFITQKELKKLR